MNDLKLLFRSLEGRCHGNQFYGQNRLPFHTCEQDGQLLCTVQANKLPALVDAGEPINKLTLINRRLRG